MQRKSIVFLVLLSLTLAALSPFAHAEKRTNISPLYLRIKPAVSSYRDPDTDFGRYRTFSVFPFSLLSSEAAMNEIMEKQVLFALRNALESKGYKFVQLSDAPDFVATITVSSEYKESYVPPRTVTVPQFIPGQTVITRGSTTGTFNFNTFGNYTSYGWGSYSGSTTSRTYIPAYTTLQTYTRPGYTTGAYYPALSVSAYDGKTFKSVWSGTGAGTSDNPDPRISSQFVLGWVMGQFPGLPRYVEPPADGVIGVQVRVYTNDGNGYFPTITNLADNGPAKKAGMKLYDMMLAIDGVPLINKSASEGLKSTTGEPGTSSIFEVWRMGRRLSFRVVRVPSTTVKYK